MVIAVRTERGTDGLEIVKEADTDADRARLQHEAGILRRAAHPGVVEVTSVGPSFLRLRHRGTSLARLGPMAPDSAAAIVRAVADIVDALHRQGIIHTRIDDDHVVVDDRGRPRLAGFGAATDASAEVTEADDVAALGALLDDLLDNGGDALWSPSHRGVRNAPRRKRALTGFRAATAQARRDDAAQRITARQFATALHEAFPDLRLPAVGPGEGDTRDFAEIPTDIDPTDDLGWTDDDLWYLAVEPDEPAPTPKGDPYASLASLSPDLHPLDDDTGDPPPDDGPEADPDDVDIWAALAPDDSPEIPTSPHDEVAVAGPTPLPPVRIRAGDMTPPPAPPFPDRRVLIALAVAVLVVGAVAGSVIARAVRPFGSDTASAAATGDDAEPLPDAVDDTEPAPTPPPFPESCEVHALAGPDIDGDGCPESVALADRVATVGAIEVELGQDGDLATLADHDCDGIATPVLFRPSSGEVFVFPRWSLDEPLEVEATSVVPGGRSISTGAGACPSVTVRDDDGTVVTVAGPGS